MSGAAKRTDHGGRRGARSGTAAVEERAVRRGVVRAVAVRYPLGSFVVLAFVVSWTAWGPLLADSSLSPLHTSCSSGWSAA